MLSDTSGPDPQSIEGYQYWTSFLCAETRHIEVIIHRTRAESASKWISTAKQQQRLTGRDIGEYRRDGAGEFQSTEVYNFLEEEGILSRTTEPYNPQTNGQTERFVRSMNTKSRAMLTYSGLPVTFWPQAVQEAARLYNRTPRQYQSKQWATPLSRYQPDLEDSTPIKDFPIFGQFGHYLTVKQNQSNKFDDRGSPSIYLGCHDSLHILYCLKTHQIIRIRTFKTYGFSFVNDSF